MKTLAIVLMAFAFISSVVLGISMFDDTSVALSEAEIDTSNPLFTTKAMLINDCVSKYNECLSIVSSSDNSLALTPTLPYERGIMYSFRNEKMDIIILDNDSDDEVDSISVSCEASEYVSLRPYFISLIATFIQGDAETSIEVAKSYLDQSAAACTVVRDQKLVRLVQPEYYVFTLCTKLIFTGVDGEHVAAMFAPYDALTVVYELGNN